MSAGSFGLFDASELPIALKPPAYFKQLPRRLEADFCCPRCAYGWAGNPKPTAEEAAVEVEADPNGQATA